jgi:hypothetical protein
LSATPFHVQPVQQQLQQQPALLTQPPHTVRAALAQPQSPQQQAAAPSNSVPPMPGAQLPSTAPGAGFNPGMADIVIMDGEGGILHYQTSIEQAAAAACTGRVPVGSTGSGALRVYGPQPGSRGTTSRQSLNSSGGSIPQQGLTQGMHLVAGCCTVAKEVCPQLRLAGVEVEPSVGSGVWCEHAHDSVLIGRKEGWIHS